MLDIVQILGFCTILCMTSAAFADECHEPGSIVSEHDLAEIISLAFEENSTVLVRDFEPVSNKVYDIFRRYPTQMITGNQILFGVPLNPENDWAAEVRNSLLQLLISEFLQTNNGFIEIPDYTNCLSTSDNDGVVTIDPPATVVLFDSEQHSIYSGDNTEIEKHLEETGVHLESLQSLIREIFGLSASNCLSEESCFVSSLASDDFFLVHVGSSTLLLVKNRGNVPGFYLYRILITDIPQSNPTVYRYLTSRLGPNLGLRDAIRSMRTHTTTEDNCPRLERFASNSNDLNDFYDFPIRKREAQINGVTIGIDFVFQIECFDGVLRREYWAMPFSKFGGTFFRSLKNNSSWAPWSDGNERTFLYLGYEDYRLQKL